MSNHHFIKEVKKMAKQTKNKRKKIFSKDFPLGSSAWKYARMLEEKRGHSYQYLTDDKWNELEKKGYKMWDFSEDTSCTKREYAIQSECLAKNIAIMLRQQGNYARVIAGGEQNQQRIKMFSVIYKRRKPST